MIKFIAVSSLIAMAAAPSAMPYKWGVYKPAPRDGKVIIVDWFSEEGRARLARSAFNNDFYQLAHMYQPQMNPVAAGVATSVIFLNAFRLPKHTVPSDPKLQITKPAALGKGVIPFPAYSQQTLLNEKTDKVKDRKVLLLQNVTKKNENDKKAFKPGTSLDELKALLKVYGVQTQITYADTPDGAATFRDTLKKTLADKNHFILSNFNGTELGASTEGTVSPLAAYDEASDSVLVLDVTGHKNPWYWVPLEALYRAMNTSYGEPEKTWRGYAVVSDL